MLHASNKQEFLNAEMDEINGLLKMNAWKYCHISTLPSGAQLINSVWSYCHKRMVDGHLLNTKHAYVLTGDNKNMALTFSSHMLQ